MKGIILAGGNGKRLDPLTRVTNKHLLPIYDKPMIMYPLATMIKAGITEIVIVTSGEYIGHFYRLIGNGSEWGGRVHYEIQEGSGGTGEALLCARHFMKDEDFMVILGDNIVLDDLSRFVENFKQEREEFEAKILIAKVEQPLKYGVVEYEGNRIIKLVEKPDVPFSNYVSTGLWIFKSKIFDLCDELELSVRNEYETTDILAQYAEEGKLTYEMLEGEWTDAGTIEEMYRATNLVYKLKNRIEGE